MESDYAIHLRNKEDFLKSLIFGLDIEDEYQEYLLSSQNLVNKGLLDSFDGLDEIILKNRKSRHYSGKGLGASTSLLSLPTPHRWEGKINSSKQALHSVWPSANLGQGDYSVHPFSMNFHPLLEKDPVTGYPAFVESLRDYYLTEEDSPSTSEKHGEIELKHNSHHKKPKPVDKDGNISHESDFLITDRILGDLDEHGVGAGTTEHGLYERAFQIWKDTNRKEIDNLISKEGATEKDLRRIHFDDAARDWISEDYQEDELGEPHPHRLGWLGYNLGLEWLSPKERSQVVEHLFQGGADDEPQENKLYQDIQEMVKNSEGTTSPEEAFDYFMDFQPNNYRKQEIDNWNEPMTQSKNENHVKLQDGTKIPLARLHRTFPKRAIPEFMWATGTPDRTLPNTKSHIQTHEDSPFSMQDRPYFVRDLMENFEAPKGSAHDNMLQHLLGEISTRLHDSVTDDSDVYGTAKHNFVNFPSTKSEIEEVKSNYLKQVKKLQDKEDTSVSKEDMNKIFYNTVKQWDMQKRQTHDLGFHKNFSLEDFKNLKSLHSSLDNENNPIFEEDYMKDFADFHEQGSGIVDRHFKLKNSLIPFTRIHGPSKDSVSEDIANHYDKYGDNLETLAFHWAHPFQRGGLGLLPETFVDILHNTFKDEDDESLLGAIDEVSGIFKLHPELENLFGHIGGEKLNFRSRHPMTISQVFSQFNSSNPNNAKASTNVHDNSLERARNPKMINQFRGEKLHDKIQTEGMSRFGNVSDIGKIKGGGGYIYDTNIANNSSIVLRDGVMRGLYHKPGDIDPATNRVLLGSPVRNYSVMDILNGKAPMPEVGDSAGLAEFLLRGNLDAYDPEGKFGDIEREKNDLLEHFDYLLETEKALSEGKKWNDAKQDYEDYVYDPEETSALENKIKVQRNVLEEEYDNLQAEKMNLVNTYYTGEKEGLSKNWGKQFITQNLIPHLREKNADDDVLLRLAKEQIMPKMIEKDPDAFDYSNPSKALANLSEARHLAELLALHSKHEIHGLSTPSNDYREKTQQSIESRLGESPHQKIAQSISDAGVPIDKESDVMMTLMQMGILPNEHHQKIVEDAIAQGKTHLTTIGSLMAQNLKLHPNMEKLNLPEEIESHSDFLSHFDEEVSLKGKGMEAVKEARHHPYNARISRINTLMNLAKPEELENYGLEYHQLPNTLFGEETTKGGDSRKYNNRKNKMKRMLHQIVSYDEGMASDLENIEDVGDITGFEYMGGTQTPNVAIDSVRSGNGAVPYLHHSSSANRMHHGYVMQPSLSGKVDANGNLTIGDKTSANLRIPVNEHDIQYMLGAEGFSALQNSVQQNPANFESYLQTTQMNVERGTPENPTPESVDYMNISKSLPKEMPLIEPYHKVFDYEDIEQLRGFTGEWVVTAMEMGERVKITKKSTYVELKNSKNEKVGVSDKMRSYIRKLGSRDFIMDGVLNSDGIHIIDLMYYDDTDVTDMDSRERMKLLRSQFDSHENVFVPSPSTVRITDDEGLESAIKYLREENKDSKILIRDAKSTYMKGEEKHPKWILFTKSSDNFPIPFTTEIKENVFLLNFEHDVLKFNIENGEPVNPRSAISELSNSDYTLKLAKSLEDYWKPSFYEMLKEEKEEEVIPDNRARQIEEESAGILKPKKDPNLILKPKMMKQIITVLERSLDALEKSQFPMTAGKGLGIDVGSDIDSPRGPTQLHNEATLPDWDMKERPEQDPEKEEDYPKKKKVKN